MRQFHLIGVFMRSSFQKEAAYRFNFGANLLNTILGLAGSIGGVLVIFSARKSLNGWSFRQVLALTGVYLLIQALKNLATAPSLNSLTGFSGELWTGRFDFVLLKPVSPQFHVSFKDWSFWSVFDALLAVGIIISAVSGLPGQTGSVSGSLGGTIPFSVSTPAAGPVSAALFIAAVAISLVLVYSILLLLGSAAFWYLGTPLSWIFDAFIQAGRFPVGIYPGFLKLFLTWLIPVAFIITVPAEVLTGGANIAALIGGALISVLLFVLSSAFFRLSVRRYTSASS
jgi:ABC-2 type transport system permease protein